MTILRLLFLLPLLCYHFWCFGQEEYAQTDSVMRSFKEKVRTADELHKVTYFIRNNFKNDSLKLRAAFIWITENIAYDVKAWQQGDPAASRLNYVIQNKQAICSGYANLLKFFCDAFGIENEIVVGRARGGTKDVYMRPEVRLSQNHAWNAVKINNKWRLIDPTWASGYVDDTDEKNVLFIKEFKEGYYFIPADRLILSHLPIQAKYQYSTKLVNEYQFKAHPMFLYDYQSLPIEKVLPDTALIKIKKGGRITFKFKTAFDITEMTAWSNTMEKAAFTGTTIRKDDWIEFSYPATMPGIYNLYIAYPHGLGWKNLLVYRLQVE